MSEQPVRREPEFDGGEREQLGDFLDYLRATVLWKCSGLTDEQARRRHVPSELTTIAGLLAHLTYVEGYWFGVVLNGQPDPWRARFEPDPDAEFRAALEKPLSELRAEYEHQCANSREIAAGLAPGDTVEFKEDSAINLRWVLIHLIEETARHAGHLDLLRELTDGATGE
ncbi:DinB family protein [Amycolatopsis acidicola]|uniref:DinB family protein n=1 Tax=Amycolatopsis acidicola TaxID=2596893 RepID=A0A5N0UR94_9PSEU|nr:DinB family protein [Amycolatopsis acidicola]KAA9151717.1 DinB family protein [Amycolatopsis acidicola]